MIYHETPRRFFALASEPRAILVLPQTPYRINEGRIADFLITQLEGIDKTSTFFEEVYRLPPAHTLTITPAGMRMRRYWTLEPGPELRLSTDEEYAEAFLEVFTEAVRCRLRGVGPVGSTLSGGMDSGSVVAVARTLLAEAGRGPLPTFSGVSPDGVDCVETRTIHAAQTMDGLDPHVVVYGQWGDLLPELQELTWNLDEPFDSHMTLLRALYLDARRHGVTTVLDGIDGDTYCPKEVTSHRLIRERSLGNCLSGNRRSEIVSQGGVIHPDVHWFKSDRAVTAESSAANLRNCFHLEIAGLTLKTTFETSIISPTFAKRVDLAGRLETLSMNHAQESRHLEPSPGACQCN